MPEEERVALWYALFTWREKLRARHGTFTDETYTNHHIAVWW